MLHLKNTQVSRPLLIQRRAGAMKTRQKIRIKDQTLSAIASLHC